jgi:hypothetical protein
MGIHLMVIGRRPPKYRMFDDEYIEEVAGVVTRTRETRDSAFLVRRCTHPRELVQIVRRVAVEHGARIDTLDLFDHGAPGLQRMGRDILFDDAKKNLAIASELRQLLSEHARLRLLGCETAWGTNGRNMLLDLQEALDVRHSVVVYGSIAPITVAEFGAQGFEGKYFEEICLVSSTEVRRDKVRTLKERSSERREWRRTQRALLRNDAPNPNSEV